MYPYGKAIAVIGAAEEKLLCGDHARTEDVQCDLILELPVVHRRGHLVVNVSLDVSLLVAPHPNENLQLLYLRDATLLANVGQCVLGGALDDLLARRGGTLDARHWEEEGCSQVKATIGSPSITYTCPHQCRCSGTLACG